MMDKERAIEELKSRIALIDREYKNKAKEYREVLQMAVDAIDKQVPMQPRYEGDGYCDGELVYDMAYCPKCDHDFEYNINDWGSKFCPDCGQALDWSVGEEGEGEE